MKHTKESLHTDKHGEEVQTKETPWLYRNWNKICFALASIYLLLIILFPQLHFYLRAAGIYLILLLILFLFIVDQDPWFTKSKQGKDYKIGWWTGKHFLPKLKFASLLLIVVCIIDLFLILFK